MNTLVIQTAKYFLIGALLLGVLLFLPAWTFAYWQAWIFIIVFLVATNAIGVYLVLKDPALLWSTSKPLLNGCGHGQMVQTG